MQLKYDLVKQHDIHSLRQYSLLFDHAHYLAEIPIKHITVAVSRYNWYRNCLYARQNKPGQVDLIVPQLIL